jgi:hypothetical protein
VVAGVVLLLEQPVAVNVAAARMRAEILLKYFISLLRRQKYPTAYLGWVNANMCDCLTRVVLHEVRRITLAKYGCPTQKKGCLTVVRSEAQEGGRMFRGYGPAEKKRNDWQPLKKV